MFSKMFFSTCDFNMRNELINYRLVYLYNISIRLIKKVITVMCYFVQ